MTTLPERPTDGTWTVTLSDQFTTDTWIDLSSEQANEVWWMLGGTGSQGTGTRKHYGFSREEFADVAQAHGNAGLVAEHPDDSMEVRHD